MRRSRNVVRGRVRNQSGRRTVDHGVRRHPLDASELDELLAGRTHEPADPAAAFCADLRRVLGGESIDAPMRRTWTKRPPAIKKILASTSARIGAGGLAAFLAFGGVAAAGALPRAVQDPVASVAHQLGLGFVPSPGAATPADHGVGGGGATTDATTATSDTPEPTEAPEPTDATHTTTGPGSSTPTTDGHGDHQGSGHNGQGDQQVGSDGHGDGRQGGSQHGGGGQHDGGGQSGHTGSGGGGSNQSSGGGQDGSGDGGSQPGGSPSGGANQQTGGGQPGGGDHSGGDSGGHDGNGGHGGDNGSTVTTTASGG